VQILQVGERLLRCSVGSFCSQQSHSYNGTTQRIPGRLLHSLLNSDMTLHRVTRYHWLAKSWNVRELGRSG